ncbi:MAG: hypothetical protein JWM86_856, partial [Thermoleophilia bacterium]|nr:hypothetical protein [Thermoleophilia bacterium]
MTRERSTILPALAAFAVFGAFWGAWGASIPRVRDQAGVSEAELGIALLCIGAGALPAMLLTGRLLDRVGVRLAGFVIAALGIAGLAATLAAHSFVSLVLGLLAVGVASGAADVAMNSVAGRAEQDAGRPVITRAHGVLSAFVVIGSLVAGAVAAQDLPLELPFAGIAAGALAVGAWMLRVLPPATAHAAGGDVTRAGVHSAFVPLLLLGVLGALGF